MRRRFLVMCLILVLMTPLASLAQEDLTLEVEKQGLDFYIGSPTVGTVFAFDGDKVRSGVASTLPFLSYRTDVGPIESVDPTLSVGVEYIDDATYLGGALTIDVSSLPAGLLGKGLGAVFGDAVGSAVSGATFVQFGAMGGWKVAGDEEARDSRLDLYVGGGLKLEF